MRHERETERVKKEREIERDIDRRREVSSERQAERERKKGKLVRRDGGGVTTHTERESIPTSLIYLSQGSLICMICMICMI